MTQDVADETIAVKLSGQWYTGTRVAAGIVAEMHHDSVLGLKNERFLTCWLYRLMLAGFCFTLMTGCCLTYKGPAYDCSQFANVRSQPVRDCEASRLLTQQRDRQRTVLP